MYAIKLCTGKWVSTVDTTNTTVIEIIKTLSTTEIKNKWIFKLIRDFLVYYNVAYGKHAIKDSGRTNNMLDTNSRIIYLHMAYFSYINTEPEEYVYNIKNLIPDDNDFKEYNFPDAIYETLLDRICDSTDAEYWKDLFETKTELIKFTNFANRYNILPTCIINDIILDCMLEDKDSK